MTPNSADTRDLVATIDDILWRVWDPIGVNDVPAARDEYASYAPGILTLLRRGADDAEIIRHLQTIEAERMGLPAGFTARREATVSALRARLGSADQPTGER